MVSDERITHIPFQVDLSRIIDVLAKEIYQSPLALLRENTQNAYDAVLLRGVGNPTFRGTIDITIGPLAISVHDNGVGMTKEELKDHYWTAGSSSKGNPAARAAGVVGTFGIGAMANFGIATSLEVVTESIETGQRTRSFVRRDQLSLSNNTIEIRDLPSTGQPGTTVTATIDPKAAINVQAAEGYIREFVSFVRADVRSNGQTISGKDLADEVKAPPNTTVPRLGAELAHGLTADYTFASSPTTGEIWVRLDAIRYRDADLPGTIILRQGLGPLRTFRSGFGLAAVGVSSAYQFGGVANLLVLEPTAGREALTSASLQLLQTIIGAVDAIASEDLAIRPESDLNSQFMEWVRSRRRFDLCSNLTARVEPQEDRVRLGTLRQKSAAKPLLIYEGNDQSIIQSIASDDSPLVVIAMQQPRRQCEVQYLKAYCTTEQVTDSPRIIARLARDRWTMAQQAVVFRVAAILETDYFVRPEIGLGTLSHSLPVLAESAGDQLRALVLDVDAPTLAMICDLYDSNYQAFGSMVKDFIRNLVFPRIADFVPSSTRHGAEAFLKNIRRTRDVFEYEASDLDSYASIWNDYLKGEISLAEAADRSTRLVLRNIQVVDVSAARPMDDVVPGVPLGPTEEIGPAPPIMRTEVASDAKLLTLDSGDATGNAFACFIALSERAYEEHGEFFMQPHSTSVVWSGQRVMFVFEHHSGLFGLYYDLQADEVVSPESGGRAFPTTTLVLKDKVFIPVPRELRGAFVPREGERKRFEVSSNLLYTDSSTRLESGSA